MTTTTTAVGTIVRHRLGNGLRVVIAPDRTSPVVGVAVHYGVGFRSEPPGRSGFAHLFEHVMFQGAAGTPTDHFRQVEAAGGFCNASTRQDYTDFYDIVPTEALPHVLSLEAGRMREPKLTDRAVRTQADVVREEILTKSQRPYGRFPWPLISPVLFDSYANAHDGYGDYAALRHVTVDECREFFDRYYGPGNAVLTVAGDVEPDTVIDLVERHFGTIAARPVPAAVPLAEPAPPARRTHHAVDLFAPLPALAVGHRIPDPAAGPDAHVGLAMLAQVLVGGAGPRLTKRLTEAVGSVARVSARAGLFDFLDARDPDMWIITATHQPEVRADQVLDVLDTEVAELAARGPADDELRRAQARQANGYHRALDQLAGRIRTLGRFTLLFDAPELVHTLADRFAGVDAAQISAAARLLRPDTGALLIVTPADPGGPT